MRAALSKSVSFACEKGSYSPIKICASAKNVCVFGLGRFFQEAFETWNFKEKFQVNLLSDNNSSKWGQTINNLPCVSPMELSKFDDLIVIPLVGDREPIIKQMQSMGIRCLDPEECLNESLSKIERSPKWFNENRIMDVYDMLADEESKRIYSSLLINRIAFGRYHYGELFSNNQYFPDFFRFHNNEVFIDCGAYTGDTLKRFINNVPSNEFKQIYAFEADEQNYNDLRKSVNRNNIFLYHAGVWNETGKLSFGRETYGSFEYVSVLKIDDFFLRQTVPAVRIDDITNNATFIKMDIEGAELNALKGAKKTIIANTPKLAISIYHQLNDLWEIPIYIKQLVPEYKLYVRHHSKTIAETVLYACI